MNLSDAAWPPGVFEWGIVNGCEGNLDVYAYESLDTEYM